MEQGVRAVIYDNNEEPYFLIFHRPKTGWELLKGRIEQGETSEQALKREINEKAKLSKYKILRKLGVIQKIAGGDKLFNNQVFLVEANMNIPVTPPNRINTYLWTKKENAVNKLKGTDKQLLEMALKEIQNIK
jgi:8-oxo-dGTP pyrophosphatase MutT (NUDIX family)